MDFTPTPPICNFGDLRQQMVTLMESRNYSWHSLDRYRQILNRLEKYLAEKNTSSYSREIGNDFLMECKQYRGNYQGKKPRQTDMARIAAHILNEIMEKGDFNKARPTPKYVCPDCFSDELDQYLDDQKQSGKKEVTVDKIRVGCSQFLIVLKSLGVSSLDEIVPQKIYASMTEFSSQVMFCLYVPPFLKYLYRQGVLNDDYSTLIPTYQERTPVPTVYESDEIESLLSVIDRTQVKGKRDYAMLLLAVRLGLRVSDIAALSFGNVDFDKRIIVLSQVKTNIPIKLPLLNEIESALREYIAVRPQNTLHEKIFLRSKAPYIPISRTAMNNFMKRYFHAAKINIKGRKCGPQSLRSSLASALVAENVPYSVTQKILGHNDHNSIKHYVRLDIEQLRKYALEVPAPTGNFSKLLVMGGTRI